jgi:hypothetical protein
MRGLAGLDPRHVMSIEGSWHGFEEEMRRGTWTDFGLFGTKEQALVLARWMEQQFPEAVAIDIDRRGVIEINPEHTSTNQEMFLNHEPGVVFDTWHANKADAWWKTGDPFWFAFELNKLQRIRLVHIQTRNQDELKDFLAGEPTFMGSLAKHALACGCDAIIEVPPCWLKRNPVKKLKLFRGRVADLVS